MPTRRRTPSTRPPEPSDPAPSATDALAVAVFSNDPRHHQSVRGMTAWAERGDLFTLASAWERRANRERLCLME